MHLENVEQMSCMRDVSRVSSKNHTFVAHFATGNANECFIFVGILFRNSWTTIPASTVTFNLDARSSFSWI